MMGRFYVVAEWYEPAEDGTHYVARIQVGPRHDSYGAALVACKQLQRDGTDGPYTFRVREDSRAR